MVDDASEGEEGLAAAVVELGVSSHSSNNLTHFLPFYGCRLRVDMKPNR